MGKENKRIISEMVAFLILVVIVLLPISFYTQLSNNTGQAIITVDGKQYVEFPVQQQKTAILVSVAIFSFFLIVIPFIRKKIPRFLMHLHALFGNKEKANSYYVAQAYVRVMHNHGYDDKLIKQHLHNAGWNEDTAKKLLKKSFI